MRPKEPTRARELFAEIGHATLLSFSLSSMADVAFERGDLKRAEKLMREAIRLLAPLGQHRELAESQADLARSLAALRRDRRRHAASAAALTRSPTSPSRRASSRGRRSSCARSIGCWRRSARPRARGVAGRAGASCSPSRARPTRPSASWSRRRSICPRRSRSCGCRSCSRSPPYAPLRNGEDEAEELSVEALAIADEVDFTGSRGGGAADGLSASSRTRARTDKAAALRGASRRARACREHRRDRLIRLLVRRLADHRRRPLEAVERLAQRVGAQRAFAVGQVLRLVAVRERDVGEVDVEWRARLLDGVDGLERGLERLARP